METIAVIGTGYVGLVTGASLADLGHSVVCVDVDTSKIDSLQSGSIPFFEPGLQELVERGIEAQRLSFTRSYGEALQGTDFCFLALPTPPSADESCDLSYLLGAIDNIAAVMEGPLAIIIKSTVPVGTAEQVVRRVSEKLGEQGKAIPFEVISNPEFLREGSAVRDFKEPKRILLGVATAKAERTMRALYAPFADKIVVTDRASAELAKYAANAMLAVRLSMINSFAQLCERFGCDIENICHVLKKDPRIGSHYLEPGIGFGGSCLPKDLRALVAMSKGIGHDPALFEEILNINQHQQELFFDKILAYFGGVAGKKLAIWGLAFKPDTDDMREAPSLSLCRRLLDAGAILRLYDPVALKSARLFFQNEGTVDYCDSEAEAATGADAIVLVTQWKRFSFVDFEKIGVLMRTKVFFDGRNQFAETKLVDAGFDYFCVGKQTDSEVVSWIES